MALQPVILNQDVSPLDISRFAQPVTECCNTAGKGTGCPTMNKSDNRWRGLLRARRNRQRRCRAAEQRDERAALHSITSSARASSVSGTADPILIILSAGKELFPPRRCRRLVGSGFDCRPDGLRRNERIRDLWRTPGLLPPMETPGAL